MFHVKQKSKFHVKQWRGYNNEKIILRQSDILVKLSRDSAINGLGFYGQDMSDFLTQKDGRLTVPE